MVEMQKDCWPLLFVLNLRHLGFLPIGNNPCPVGRVHIALTVSR